MLNETASSSAYNKIFGNSDVPADFQVGDYPERDPFEEEEI